MFFKSVVLKKNFDGWSSYQVHRILAEFFALGRLYRVAGIVFFFNIIGAYLLLVLEKSEMFSLRHALRVFERLVQKLSSTN